VLFEKMVLRNKVSILKTVFVKYFENPGFKCTNFAVIFPRWKRKISLQSAKACLPLYFSKGEMTSHPIDVDCSMRRRMTLLFRNRANAKREPSACKRINKIVETLSHWKKCIFFWRCNKLVVGLHRNQYNLQSLVMTAFHLSKQMVRFNFSNSD